MDQKLTDKTPLTSYELNDLIHVVDVSDVSSSPQGTSKKSTINLLGEFLNANFNSLIHTYSTRVTNPIISSGVYDIVALPAIAGKRYIVVSIQTSNVSSVNIGNTTLGAFYGSDNTIYCLEVIDLSGPNSLVTSSSSDYRESANPFGSSVTVRFSNGTDQTLDLVTDFVIQYMLVDSVNGFE